MAKSIMVLGTMSNVGKSVITGGLCRIFRQDGFLTAPFKSQNMALNSYITRDGLEMGRAQVMQAECAKIEPDVRMNPILLKPTNVKGSQVIVNGEVQGYMNAKEYFAYKRELIPTVMESYESLSDEYEIIVIEGAGSPAEINLKSEDIVNMGLAKMTNSPCILVADIDRGGVFASIYGTIALLEEDERRLIKGIVINKFRGDLDLLKPGIKQIEELIDVPVLGVVPYSEWEIDEEDSLAERLNVKREAGIIDIAVIRLPRMSNFTDFNAFENIKGVSLRYVRSVGDFKEPDLCIIPGTKNTIADLYWMRENGLEVELLKHESQGKPIFGVCGGYQMLGKAIRDPNDVEEGGSIRGISLLDCETVFQTKKTRTRRSGTITKVEGMFQNLSGKDFDGYEIHMGCTGQSEDVLVSKNNIYGTYIHGFFDNADIVNEIVESLCREKGIDFYHMKKGNIQVSKEAEYDRLANLLRNSIDVSKLYQMIQKG